MLSPAALEKEHSAGSAQLQEIVDSIVCFDEFLNLNLSVTIADPLLQDCPLIACSEGFTELTGYNVSEIVGRNCRFLLNGVPEEVIEDETRTKCREYVSRTKGQPEEELTDRNLSEYLKRKPWATLAQGELICVQTNATKTGELFKNMFYLKQVELNEKPFILGLQARLPEEWETSVDEEELERFCQQAFARLGKNISAVELVLSKQFWYSATARRQDGLKTILPDSKGGTDTKGPVIQFGIAFSMLYQYGFLGGLKGVPLKRRRRPIAKGSQIELSSRKGSATSTALESVFSDGSYFDIDTDVATASASTAPARPVEKAPAELHKCFDKGSVQQFPSGRFELIRKIEDANRNFGSVCLMRDLVQGNFVACKQMPNSWIQKSHQAFNLAHPHETEQPWNDVGCNAFLNRVGFPYCADLLGVFRDEETTSVISEFVAGGDLFSWASKLTEQPGHSREALLRPLAKQMAQGVQYLHNLSIVHGDLSLENILLSSDSASSENIKIKIIDFGAATPRQFLRDHATGKPSYQAPEIFQEGQDFDGFLADVFSFGVIIYATSLMDYPWVSTAGRGDKCFQYVKAKGFMAFTKKRKLPNSRLTVADVSSQDLSHLLEGLLSLNPAERLTLGEDVYIGSDRRSAWDLQWLR
jgi:hypothetical protein